MVAEAVEVGEASVEVPIKLLFGIAPLLGALLPAVQALLVAFLIVLGKTVLGQGG
jgi:hypothetical protein